MKDKRHRNASCIAHNAKNYISYIILQFLYQNCIQPEVIMAGGKVLSIEIPSVHIKFIDSINFMPMALSKLPRAFGKESTISKGTFPHLFNTEENQNYSGCIPAEQFFDPEGMSPSSRKDFDWWYANEKRLQKQWVLQDELLKYCTSDVDVLRQCCMRFRSIFLEASTKSVYDDNGSFVGEIGIDPFENCITLASVCNLLYRRNYLQPDTIAIIPPRGFAPKQNFSPESIRWLCYVAQKRDIQIRHAMNLGEERINGRITVDRICHDPKVIFDVR